MDKLQIIVLHTYKDWVWVQIVITGEEPCDPVTHTIAWLESFPADNGITVSYA